MFPIWNPRYKQPPHCRFRLGNTSGSRKHDATWIKWVNFDFYLFISSCSALEMFPSWNPWWNQIPHCRFGLGAIPGTRKHHATWNKWVNFNFHPFNSVCSAPEMFPTWNPWWKQLPDCRFRLGNSSGTRKHLATWNKRVNFDFYLFISSCSVLEMFPSWNPWWNQIPHCCFRLGAIPGTRKHHATWNKY